LARLAVRVREGEGEEVVAALHLLARLLDGTWGEEEAKVGSQIAPILVESYGAEETQVRKAALTCLVSLCLQVRIEMEKNCLLTPRMNTCRWGKTTWLPTLPGFLEQKESCSLSTFTGQEQTKKDDESHTTVNSH